MCNSSCKNDGCGEGCGCAKTENGQAITCQAGCDGGCESCSSTKADDPTEIKCPECGGKIEQTYTCPGYEMEKGQIYRCSSGCSNARLFTCQECYWHWQDELHRLAYNHAENEAKRPTWADYA